MIVPKMRTRHVPVKVLRLQIQSEHVGKQDIQRARKIPHGMPKINNVVLVHGGFVDGAGWRGAYDILKDRGFNVSIVQNPTISLARDVGATKLIIDSQSGPVILLVVHSYGGVVITEAGTNPNV